MYPHEVKDIHSKSHTFTQPTAASLPADPVGYQPSDYDHQEYPKHLKRESDGVVFTVADERQEQNVKAGREPEEDAPAEETGETPTAA